MIQNFKSSGAWVYGFGAHVTAARFFKQAPPVASRQPAMQATPCLPPRHADADERQPADGDDSSLQFELVDVDEVLSVSTADGSGQPRVGGDFIPDPFSEYNG